MFLLLLAACDGPAKPTTLPDAGAVTLSPAEPRTDDVVTAAVSGARGDLVYRWTVDGVEAGTGATLDGAAFAKGQVVTVEVTATLEDATDTASASVTVVNTPPVGPTVTASLGEDGLACVATGEGTDADGDDVAMDFRWTTEGAEYAGATVPLEETARGSVWTCEATPHDGEEAGAPVTASVTLEGPLDGAYAFEKVLDLTMPGDLAPLPDGTLLVATLLGDLIHVDPDAAEVLGELTLYGVDDLIAVEPDPRFGDGTHDYVYTWTNHTCVLERHAITTEPLAVTRTDTLVTLDCPLDGGHAGGDLLFWGGETDAPVLYLGVGPTRGSSPQNEYDPGQKLLAYAIADDGTVTPAVETPFANPHVVSLGLRNPWRLADCGSVICVADPGSTEFEEINLYTGPGQNFGYPRVEGPGDGTYDEPVLYWATSEETYTLDDADGNGRTGFVHSPVVGVRATAAGYAGRLDGFLLYGDLYDGWIRAAAIDDAGAMGATVPVASLPFVLSMTETPDGTIWAVPMSGGLWRLGYRADRATVAEVGAPLSEAGMGGVAYDVRYPLWSNGADKTRLIELPPGTTIDTSDPDAWVFPDGTRLWKSFTVDGAPVETRLLEKRGDEWVAGVYVWDGDDAFLSDGTRTEIALPSGETYTVPSERACFTCHAATTGKDFPLGIEPFQLGDEGLATLAGLFSVDPGAAPHVATEDPLEAEVRGYLHGNCAYCHQPAGVVSYVSVIGLDLRYSAAETGILGAHAEYWHANPNADDGLPLLVPGDPDASALVGMLEDADMPPVGTWAPDTAAIATLRDWIAAMPSEAPAP